MVRTRMGLVLGLMLALGAVACGSDNVLEGSISESISLNFDRVDILKQGQSLRIEYIREVSGGTNKAAMLILDTTGLSLTDDAVLKDDTFMAKVELQRLTSAGDEFPEISSGELRFFKFAFSEGDTVDGEFNVFFVNGRTLHGEFKGKIKEVTL